MNAPPEMTEREWQSQVTDLAKAYRWRVYHTLDSRGSHAGFPDLVLVRPPRLIFAELKRKDGRVTPAQQEWLDAIGAVADGIDDAIHLAGVDPDVGIEVAVWRPTDFDAVAAALRP